MRLVPFHFGQFIVSNSFSVFLFPFLSLNLPIWFSNLSSQFLKFTSCKYRHKSVLNVEIKSNCFSLKALCLRWDRLMVFYFIGFTELVFSSVCIKVSHVPSMLWNSVAMLQFELKIRSPTFDWIADRRFGQRGCSCSCFQPSSFPHENFILFSNLTFRPFTYRFSCPLAKILFV